MAGDGLWCPGVTDGLDARVLKRGALALRDFFLETCLYKIRSGFLSGFLKVGFVENYGPNLKSHGSNFWNFWLYRILEIWNFGIFDF